MKKFNLILEEVLSSISESVLLESGIAIKGISKIKKENIIPTLQLLQEKVFTPIGIQRNSWDLLGSTGKKPESGDIDIAMNINKALVESNSKDEFEYAEKLVNQCKKLGWQVNNRINTGFKMVHIGIPIVGQNDQIAQVDIMTSTDMEFTKFKYFAPAPNESKYKGAFRSMLIDCILKYSTLEAAEDATDDEKQSYTAPDGKIYPYIRFQHLALGVDGLWKNIKTLKGKRGFLSTPKKDKENSKFLSSNPNEILDLLFGKGTFNISDFNSFETIWNNVLFSEKFPYKDKIKDIIIGFIRYLNNNNSFQLEQNKLPLPQEIIDYCNTNNININEVIKLKDED